MMILHWQWITRQDGVQMVVINDMGCHTIESSNINYPIMTQDSPVTKGGKDYENHKYIRG
jgi:hypothetical protein